MYPGTLPAHSRTPPALFYGVTIQEYMAETLYAKSRSITCVNACASIHSCLANGKAPLTPMGYFLPDFPARLIPSPVKVPIISREADRLLRRKTQ